MESRQRLVRVRDLGEECPGAGAIGRRWLGGPRQRGWGSLQLLAPRGLSGQQKRTWISSSATQLESSEILYPVAIRHVRILGLPLSQLEQVFLGNLPFLRAIA